MDEFDGDDNDRSFLEQKKENQHQGHLLFEVPTIHHFQLTNSHHRCHDQNQEERQLDETKTIFFHFRDG